MFFNISNHPAHAEKSTWSPEQIHAADKIAGEVVDIPFPEIKPGMTMEERRTAAHSLVEKIETDYIDHLQDGEAAAAMVAGEYIQTILLIAELQNEDIPCYFGQSARVAEEREENGQVAIVHKFVFQGFEKAPQIRLED